MGPGRRRRGPAREEPAASTGQGAAPHPRPGPRRRSPAPRSRTTSTELWAILDWTTPGLLGPLKAFRTRCAVPSSGRDPSTARAARPAGRARSCCAAARPTPASRPTCRPRPRPTSRAPLTTEQATLYEAVVREIAGPDRAAPTGIARRGLVLKLLTALKQICNHPAQYLKQTRPARSPAGPGSWSASTSWSTPCSPRTGSVLVFTQYVAMGRLLEAHLAAPRRRTAVPARRRTPSREREAMVDRFQAGEAPVFLLVAQGRRHRAQPHPRRPRRPLRPLVEPGRRGPGHRPGLPHRPDPAGAGAPAGLRGHRRGPDRRAARPQAGARRRGGRPRRGGADRAAATTSCCDPVAPSSGGALRAPSRIRGSRPAAGGSGLPRGGARPGYARSRSRRTARPTCAAAAPWPGPARWAG